MRVLFLVQILFQRFFTLFIKISYGNEILQGNYATVGLELFFQKKYWYEGKEWSYLVALIKTYLPINYSLV